MSLSDKSRTLSAKDLAICGVFGALILAMGFILGSAIIMATGIPASGSLLNVIVAVFIASIGFKLVDKFGSGIVMLTIEGAISVPTLINGPPGLHKILLLFIVGLTADIILKATNRSNKGYYLMGLVAGVEIVTLIYLSLVVLGLPGAEKLQAIIIPLAGFSGLMGAVGAYLGVKIYDEKLQKLGVVQSLKS
jgi:hypothetical protein